MHNDRTATAAEQVEDLVRGAGFEGYEIFVSASRSLNIEVRNRGVELFRFAEPVGVALRVLSGGSVGFSFSTSLQRDDLLRMVENARISARTQTSDLCNVLPEPQSFPVISGVYDESLLSVPTDDKIKRALDLEEKVLGLDPRIVKVHKATYNESTRYTLIRNSHGLSGTFASTSVSSSVSAVAGADGESHMGWEFDFGSSFNLIDVDHIASGAVLRAVGLLGARKIETMRCPVLLNNYVASQIVDVLAPSLLGDNVRKGKSLLKGRVGQQVFSKHISIRDDGTDPRGAAVSPFDGEGVAHRRVVIVDQGILKEFLYDTCSGKKDGCASTGNAVRDGIRAVPRPGASNIIIEAGKATVEELLRDVERGVVITEVMGMHTANPVSGDFSVGVSGFLVEKGQVTIPVREIAVAGNIVDLFAAVEGVASDFRFFGSVGAGSLLVGALNVSGN